MSPRTIVIIGAGPSGIAVLGRLLGRLQNQIDAAPVRIVVADPHPDGRVWSRDAWPGLLMNTRASDNTVFAGGGMPDLAPTRGGMHFYDWLRETDQKPERDDFLPRQKFGEYLAWARALLVTTGVRGVAVEQRLATATNLEQMGEQYLVRLVGSDGNDEVVADAVILATGHQEPMNAVDVSPARWTGPHLGGEVTLESVEPGADLAVFGAGLNFFDLMAILTTGRGGRFSRRDGRLQYQPSGREPHIHVGSRSGLPHLSRAVRPTPRIRTHFTDAVVTGLIARGRRLSFASDVWPAIYADLQTAASGRGLEIFGEPATPDPADPLRLGELDLRCIVEPLRRGEEPILFPSEEPLSARLVELLAHDVAESYRGPGSALRGIGEMLSSCAPGVRRLVAARAISGDSYAHDVVEWFNPLVGVLASGPPVVRIEELLALIEAGVVRFLGCGVRANTRLAEVEVSAPNLGATRTFNHLVMARAYQVDVRFSSDSCVRSMVDHGLARSYEMPRESGPALDLGGIEVTDANAVVGAHGTVTPGLFAIGIPLEGLRWLTARLPVVQGEDPILRDADNIAAAIVGWGA